ncbi:MAG TPA: DoxX family protein [Phaeodactylibacter sp.]|nr:DoxX family protein [Phaeodactylibacter sp.]
MLGLGRYLYALPMAIFGLFHFMNANDMAGMVPLPGGVFWVYLTGAGLLAAAISILIGKWDKLGTALLGLMLIIFALSIHLKGVMDSSSEDAMVMMLKDLALAGAAWMYSGSMSKDSSVIG